MSRFKAEEEEKEEEEDLFVFNDTIQSVKAQRIFGAEFTSMNNTLSEANTNTNKQHTPRHLQQSMEALTIL
jgi:hypothetical protein